MRAARDGRLGFLMTFVVAALLSAMVMPAAARPVRLGGMSGVVYAASGTPLAGATVTAFALPGQKEGCEESEDLWAAVATVNTGAGGAYTLPVGPGYYRVKVSPPDLGVSSFGYRVDEVQLDGSNVTGWVGYADDVLVGTAPRVGIDVRLTSPVEISGTVTKSSFTGPALAGIEVRAPQSQGWGGQMQRLAPSTLTDAYGHYRIGGLPSVVPDPRPLTPENEALLYGLVLRDPAGWTGGLIWWHTLFGDPLPPAADQNYVPEIDASAGDAIRDAWLSPTGRITGTVTNAKGRPIAGVAIDPDPAFPMPPVYTDSKGRYALPSWTDPKGNPVPTVLRYQDPAGVYRTTWSGGVATKHTAVPVPGVPSGATIVANMKLLDGGARVAGLVWYVGGMPAAGASISAWTPGHVQDWDWGIAGSAQAACDGTYTVTGLWPGTYTVGFAPLNQYGFSVSTGVSVSAGQRLDLGTTNLPSSVIIGQVTDPAGHPQSGVQVDLFAPGEGGLALVSEPYGHAVTNSVGQFRVFTVLEGQGTVQVRFTDPTGRYPTEFWQDKPDLQSADPVSDQDPWDDNGQYLNVVLGSPVPRGVEGYVVDPSGNPVSGVEPHLHFVMPPQYDVDLPFPATDATGHYVAEIVVGGGLPGWAVEYYYNGQYIGQYDANDPNHLLPSSATQVYLQPKAGDPPSYPKLANVIFQPSS